MAERTIDGHLVWTGAEMAGDRPDWVPIIVVRAPDGLFEIHSVGDISYSRSGPAEQYAIDRLTFVVGIGPELELEYAKDQAAHS